MDPCAKEVTFIHERPVPKDTIMFFKDKQGPRLFITVADDPSVWKKDLAINERFFSEMVVCPFQTSLPELTSQITTVQDILKQRSKYPGVKDDPEALMVSKTWVLPNKIHCGPSLLTSGYPSFGTVFESVFTDLKMESVIHILKVELPNGTERQILYSLLDSGFRPSLLLIKWSFDLDEHIPTAHCAGHLFNSGYALMSYQNGYALYMYTDESLYDICSMKTVGIQNPILTELMNNFNETVQHTQTTPRPSQDNQTETQ